MKSEGKTTERILSLRERRGEPASRDEIRVRDEAYAWATETYADEPVQIQYAQGFAETLRRKRICIQEGELLAGYLYKYTYNTNFPMIVPAEFDPAGRASFRMDVRREIREIRELNGCEEVCEITDRGCVGGIADPGADRVPDHENYASDRASEEDLAEFGDAVETWLVKHWHSGHTAAGYEMLLREGFSGLLERVRAQAEEDAVCIGHGIDDQRGADGNDTLKAFIIVIEACMGYIRRYEEEAARQIRAAENGSIAESRINELRELHEALTQICRGVPQTFYQALQLVYLAHEMMYCENVPSAVSLGRLDQYLYPFYTADIASGRITPEKAAELIDDFWLKISVQRKAYQNLTLGGCGRDGRSSFNELTYMCLDTAARLRVDQPSVNFRWTDDMTAEQWEAVLRLIRTGMGFPAIFYDPCCMKALMEAGIDEEDVWDYGFIGCVELAVPGRENAYTELARLNLPKLLNLILHQGLDVMTGRRFRMATEYNLEDITSYDELETLFFRELECFARKMLRCVNEMERLYAKRYPLPYLSVLTEDCIGRGTDVNAGGAKYSSCGFNLCGTATAADSLAAIRKMVFEEKMLTLGELAEVLRDDYAGHEDLRDHAVRRCPKYGNDEEGVDRLASRIEGCIADVIAEYRTYTGGPYRLGLYTVEDHAIMGQSTGATADGRHAGKSLSNSTGASQGRDVKGPTALINSVTRFPMVRASNGMVLDIKFTPQVIGSGTGSRSGTGGAALRALISTYFRKGGMEVQVSVVSQEQLRAAQAHPEEHTDLIVRVSGFSAYFTSLRKITQDEIIERTSVESM